MTEANTTEVIHIVASGIFGNVERHETVLRVNHDSGYAYSRDVRRVYEDMVEAYPPPNFRVTITMAESEDPIGLSSGTFSTAS